MNVQVTVAGKGDGWLNVETDEWLTDKLGEPDDELTFSLEAWNEQSGISPLDCRPVIQWACQHFDRVSGPSCDSDTPLLFHSGMTEAFLSEDICVILMTVRNRYDDMTLAVIDHKAVYVLDPMQEWADVIDWARAFGGCAKGHTFVVEQTCYLHSDQTQRTHNLSDLCRLLDDNSPHQSGYVACPECPAERIEFHA